MNMKNIIISALMMSAALSNSVVVAGVPPMNMEIEKIAAAGVLGTAGATAGMMVVGQKGMALGVTYGAAFGSLAGPIGAVVGGATGAVVGGVAGATAGWLGFLVVKAVHKEIKQR